jgi:hypothetical protein
MSDLRHMADDNGVQRWETPDLSIVEYRAADGQRMRFEAYTGSDFYLKKKIGAKITTRGGRFEYAAIDNFYFLPAHAQLYSFHQESAAGSNGNKLITQEWAVRGFELPGTVRSLCRAQWHGANFSHEVRTGPFPLPLAGGPPEFHHGFPEAWDAPGGISINPDSLTLTANFLGDTAVGTVQIRNREGSRQTIAVNAPDNRRFLVAPKRYTLQSGETKRVSVKYEDATGLGDVGNLTIATPQRQFVVPLRGVAKQGAGRL